MADLDWQNVRSTNIARVALDEESGELYVEFEGGRIYAYPNQSEATLQDIVNAASPGGYVSRWLKRLPARRIS